MASRGGGGATNGGAIPPASRKMVQSLKEIVNGVSDAEIYVALKECNMDPNEAVNRLLTQDPFHEVKSKREKKKESKDTTESRPRGGGSTSNRGARSGTDRYAGRGGSSQFSSSEFGGLHGKSKRENGTSSYTSSSAPTYGAASTNTNRTPSTFSGSIGYENKAPAFSVADGTTTVSQPPLSGFQSAWMGAPGQKSMADVVKMGRPQNKAYSTPVPPQPLSTHYDDYASKAPDVSNDDDWPITEQPQTVGVQSVVGPEPHVESENVDYDRSNQYVGSQTEEGEAEDENVYEDYTAHHVSSRSIQEDASASAPIYDNDSYKNVDSFHPEDHAYEQKEVEQGDMLASEVSANMQQLNIQEERHLDEPEDDVPSVVIPNHLQVQTANCSHLSFGSFGSTMNPGFSEPFASRQLRNKLEDTPAEVDSSSVGPSETRNSEYFGDESIITPENNPVLRTGPSSGNYDLPSVSQREVLKQENPEAAHGNQYGFPSSTPGSGYSFDSTQLLNPGLPQSQTSTQMPNTTPFSNVMAAYTNSLPNTLAANGHSVRDSDLSYSPFPINQSMATKYGNSASSISGSTLSVTVALKTGVFSSSQPTQQTPPGNTVPTGPTLPHHLVHPYSQPTLPLGPFANMIGYPFLPQSYTYMPSGFQQAFAGNSTYHQQLAAMLPQYKNSVSVSSLPQSAAVPSGYGSFGNSTAVPGNYQVNQPAGPAGSTLSYDDVLNAHYKDNSQLLSLQQNENSAMWVHGAGSRTMSAVPGNTYYGFQGQNQQPSVFRQGQQQQQQQAPSQSYGGATLNYPNYYHSQTGISQEHQLQQNPRDGSLVGGSQGQPKPQQQTQQLWQNSY
ncbi:putative GBF-interacting protein [Helianthus anomalus]